MKFWWHIWGYTVSWAFMGEIAWLLHKKRRPESLLTYEVDKDMEIFIRCSATSSKLVSEVVKRMDNCYMSMYIADVYI